MAVLLDFFSSVPVKYPANKPQTLRSTRAGQAPPLQRYKRCYESSDLRELT